MALVSAAAPARQRVFGRAVPGAPCVNLDKSTKESGRSGRFNLSWQIDDNKMIYATWSEGFPSRRHQPARHPAAVQVRLPDQLGVRLEDDLGRQRPVVERRRVPGGLEGLPVLLPRRERPDRNPQRRARRGSAASRPTSAGPRPTTWPSPAGSRSTTPSSLRTTAAQCRR